VLLATRVVQCSTIGHQMRQEHLEYRVSPLAAAGQTAQRLITTHMTSVRRRFTLSASPIATAPVAPMLLPSKLYHVFNGE
jgi:hypothetical protein